GLVDRQAKGNRQACFPNDALPQFTDHLPRSEKPVHTGHVQVMLVYRGFFHERYFFFDNFTDHPRILAVAVKVTSYDYGVGTKTQGHLHGHGRMDSKATGFVTAGSDYAAAGNGTDQNGLSVEPAVQQAFHRNKESIQITMCYCSFHLLLFFSKLLLF